MKVKGYASRPAAEIKGGFASSFYSAAGRPLTFITSSIGSPLRRLMLQANAGAIRLFLLLAVSKIQMRLSKTAIHKNILSATPIGATAEVCPNSC